MRRGNKTRSRHRATRTLHSARVGVALSAGIAGAAALAGGAPGALAATRSPAAVAATHVSVATVPGGALPIRTEAATGVGQECFPTFGLCKRITETLNPASIAADGTSTSTATASVEFCEIASPSTCFPSPSGQTVVFTSSDSGEKVSATTNHNDGTYTAVVTSSTTVGQATITVTDNFTGPNELPTSISATATLTQVPGPGARLDLTVSPTSIVANGASTATATAIVTDAHGNAVPGNTVTFTSSDHSEKVSTTTDHGNGTYTVTITSSTTPEVATISAVDTSENPNLAATAPLRQTPEAAPPVPDTGASGAMPGGLGLLTLGAGLVAGAARRRRRIDGVRG